MEGSSSLGWGSPTRASQRSSVPARGNPTDSGTGKTKTNGNDPNVATADLTFNTSQLNLETYLSPEIREFQRTFLARLAEHKATLVKIYDIVDMAEKSDLDPRLADGVKDVYSYERGDACEAIDELKAEFLRLLDKELERIY